MLDAEENPQVTLQGQGMAQEAPSFAHGLDTRSDLDTAGSKETESYESLYRQLEQTVDQLEKQQNSLEASLKLYRRAKELLAACQSRIDQAESEIKKLNTDNDGTVIAEDFSEGGQRLC